MNLDNHEIKEEKRNAKEDISKKVDEKIARLSSEEQSFEERFAQMQREREQQREQLRERREKEEANEGRKRAKWRRRIPLDDEVEPVADPVIQEISVVEEPEVEDPQMEAAEEPNLWDEIHAAIREMDDIQAKPVFGEAKGVTEKTIIETEVVVKVGTIDRKVC